MLAADARRNRERLLQAGRAAFAAARATGQPVTLEQVARQAGTLLTRMRPDLALRGWMDCFADYVEAKREMGDALPGFLVPALRRCYSHSTKLLVE